MKEKTTGVHFTGPNNSTMFSDCCGSAVLQNEYKCPSCGATVVPRNYSSRWRAASGRAYYSNTKGK